MIHFRKQLAAGLSGGFRLIRIRSTLLSSHSDHQTLTIPHRSLALCHFAASSSLDRSFSPKQILHPRPAHSPQSRRGCVHAVPVGNVLDAATASLLSDAHGSFALDQDPPPEDVPVLPPSFVECCRASAHETVPPRATRHRFPWR